MKYVFTFSEINYGNIEIESDHQPNEVKIIDKILDGEANYHHTDFDDFKLIAPEKMKPRNERHHER